MLSALKKTIQLIIILAFFLALVAAAPQLVIKNDDRKMIEVAKFGFLRGGKLTLTVEELKVNALNLYITPHAYTYNH